MLYLYSVRDWEIISSILYQNLVSSSLNDGYSDYFLDAFPNVFKEVKNVDSSLVSLDNHWLIKFQGNFIRRGVQLVFIIN